LVALTIGWITFQLCFEGATIAGRPDNLQPCGRPCGPISSHAYNPHLMPARFAGVLVLALDEHVWHQQDQHRRDPSALTGISNLTRGTFHPTAQYWT